MAAEGEFPKSNGDVLFASEVNYLARPVFQVYTGTDFNASTTSGSDSNSHELTALTSGDLTEAKYVKIRVLCTHATDAGNDPAGGTASLKIEVKETGQSYSTIVDNLVGNTPSLGDGESDGIDTIEYYHLITAGQFTNGLQFQITGSSTAGTGSGTLGSITNIQTITEAI